MHGGDRGCDAVVIRYMFEYVYILEYNVNMNLNSTIYIPYINVHKSSNNVAVSVF